MIDHQRMFASLTVFSGINVALDAPLADESFAKTPSSYLILEGATACCYYGAQEINMPQKVFYKATGPKSFEWVDSPEKATQEYKEAAEVTLRQLKDTELVELPPKGQQQQSKWVISRDAG